MTDDTALLVSLNNNPSWLPQEYIQKKIRQILCAALVITVLHLVLLKVFSVLLANRSASSAKTTEKTERESVASEKEKSIILWKASYQATHLLVNLFIGCFGIYHVYNLPSVADVTEKVVGLEEYAIFGCLQAGYQLWALPVGFFFVGETTIMMFHHIAVIVVSSRAIFCTNGFRYYIPFFLGLIEISSVPLSIMNAFKNDKSLIQKYPGAYSNIRIAFGLSFLAARVIMWLPRIMDFNRIIAIMISTSEEISSQAALGATFAAATVLTLMQQYWAFLVIRGLLSGPKKAPVKNE
mmetsp:Transcript_26866/g.39912  ORF Transcript_26866/g.39912 Transcript_26866/m.39912 type:complete len:295 (-) Transcript_26866:1337-2221(-)